MLGMAVAALAVLVATTSTSVWVGAIEDRVDVSAEEGDPRAVNLRALFFTTSEGWLPMREADPPGHSPGVTRLPEQWSIVHDGRRLRRFRIDAQVDGSARGPALGLATFTGTISPPWIGAASEEFGGWPAAPAHRPLVCISGRQSSGATARLRSSRPPMLAVRDLANIARDIGTRVECGSGSDSGSVSSSEPVTDSELVIDEAFRLGDGAELIRVRLNGKQPNCEELPGREWSDFWYLRTRDGRMHWLWPGEDDATSAFGVSLLERGDFDADGGEELLFWYSGYNEDGYMLVDRGRDRIVKCGWGYH